jgi:hypothetical protein
MKRNLTIWCGCVVIAGLCGCLPEKRVTWSPDGRWAAVRAGDGLHLCDPNGKLSERLVENVNGVAWLPDSRHLLLATAVRAKTWAELTPLLDAPRVQELAELGDKLQAEMLAYEGEWDAFKPQVVEKQTGGVFAALLVYVRDHADARLPEKLGDRWEDTKKLEASVGTLQLAEVQQGTLKLGPPLLRSIDGISEPRVSPDGRKAAYLSPLPGDNSPVGLFATALEPGATPQAVAEHTSLFCDWSTDGRHLVYATGSPGAASGGKELRLGVIARRQVSDEHGQMLEKLPEAEDLAGILFQQETKVACLRDGRIIFAGLAVHLPCTTKDMPQTVGLFALDPDRQPTITRLVPRQSAADLADVLPLFDLSPDQQRVCLPASNGRIVVLTLATGDTLEVAAEKHVDELRTLPTWRSDDEVCLNYGPSPDQPGARSEISLAKINWDEKQVTIRALSGDWPTAAVEGFLVKKPDQPAASQSTR